ncbi:MAG: hypothetical protein AUK31_01655 [Fibrobacteres bacterium CG2_30_45_31]|nr:MAG: hypothetical protein AUK31_01655 [Fibrobacteres bacterium CG2_30_45_31]
MPSKEFKETLWRMLLSEIERGHIIPIVGPELLMVEVDGKSILLYDWLAKQLAESLEIDLINGTGKHDLSEIIYKYRFLPRGKPADPYNEVFDILDGMSFPVPEPLRILASIEPLRIFLTTTVDRLLEKALEESRGQVSSLSFSCSGPVEDIASEEKKSVVFHMFGKADPVPTLPTFVLTEDDLLKFSYNWNDPDRRPPRLSSILQNRQTCLMMLGCSYENWLARFFLYGLRQGSLFEYIPPRELIADDHSVLDPDFLCFLSRCNADLYPNGDAVAFVRELGKRWREKHPQGFQTQSLSATKKDPEKKAVFLSYASEDKTIARQTRDALEAEGVDVWFDEKKLESGDQYEGVIAQNIQDASFFVPIVTPNTLIQQRRFFHFEWNKAIEEAKFRPVGIPFILPLVSGDIDVDNMLIPEAFRKVHWSRFCSPDNLGFFVSECRQKVRNLNRLSH